MLPSQPEFIQLSLNVEKMLREQAEMKSALCGDALTGKIGYLGQTHKMMEDLYGLDSHGEPIESKKNTLLLRMSDVEDRNKKVKWIIGGALGLYLLARFGVAALWDKMMK